MRLQERARLTHDARLVRTRSERALEMAKRAEFRGDVARAAGLYSEARQLQVEAQQIEFLIRTGRMRASVT
jgi:hypothetical protein